MQLQSSVSGRVERVEQTEPPLISVVVPVYREESSIRPFLQRTVPVLERLGTYEIIFALDPSPDQTERVIREEIARNKNIGLMMFSRRFGQPAATMAGVFNCRGQWCVMVDVDLQDPPELIETMWRKAQEGYDVVTTRRTSREGETTMKLFVSWLGYRFINRFADVPIRSDTGDFRLVSRRVVEEIRGLSEGHGFLRGLIGVVGFPQTEVLYERAARHAGAGNYNRYLGSVKIAFDGIFGFSTFPLQLMMWTGFGLALLSALAILVVIGMKIWHGDDYPMGVPTITVLVLFIGGVQLAAVGVLGEYIGRIYNEVRRRPPYIVEQAVNMPVRDPRGPRTGERTAPGGWDLA